MLNKYVMPHYYKDGHLYEICTHNGSRITYIAIEETCLQDYSYSNFSGYLRIAKIKWSVSYKQNPNTKTRHTKELTYQLQHTITFYWCGWHGKDVILLLSGKILCRSVSQDICWHRYEQLLKPRKKAVHIRPTLDECT